MKRPVVLAIVLQLTFAAQSAWAESSASEAAKTAADTYLEHCHLCHGLGGRGDGPVADALKVAPADLTMITARNNGRFPSAKLADIIRNGGGLLGHGTTEMPAWGSAFGEKGDPDVARKRISDLVRYIESLQAP